MNGEDYKIKTGKHRGKTLKEVPASYLIFCYEKGWLEDIARKFVIANEVELRKSANKN
jgi:hypothetical protein